MYNKFMPNIIPISEARNTLPKIIRDADVLSQKTLVTVDGRVKAAIISARELDLLEETLEVLSDPEAMKKIKKGEEDVKENRLVDWEDLKQELGI